MSFQERRSHGRSPWREAYELLATRPTRTTADTIELGQSAAGVSYVKSLQVTRNDGEGWGPWLRRANEMFALAVEGLPKAPVSPSKPENGEKDTETKAEEVKAAHDRRKAAATAAAIVGQGRRKARA